VLYCWSVTSMLARGSERAVFWVVVQNPMFCQLVLSKAASSPRSPLVDTKSPSRFQARVLGHRQAVFARPGGLMAIP